MTNLEKKLVEISGKNQQENEKEIIGEAKLLLERNAQEEISTLKSIGLSAELLAVEAVKEDTIIRQKNQGVYERAIVHRTEIKKLCSDYRLYMRPADQYRGRIPADLGAKLTRFCKDKNIPLPSEKGSHLSNFFIIAPPKMFTGYKNPALVFFETLTNVTVRMADSLRSVFTDPILVYKLDDSYFAVVESWGNDLTWLRRIYGAVTSNIGMRIFNTLWFLLGVYGITKFAIWQTLALYPKGGGYEPMACLIDLVLAVVAGVWIYYAKEFGKNLRRGVVPEKYY